MQFDHHRLVWLVGVGLVVFRFESSMSEEFYLARGIWKVLLVLLLLFGEVEVNKGCPTSTTGNKKGLSQASLYTARHCHQMQLPIGSDQRQCVL